jgi:hypothetical protein
MHGVPTQRNPFAVNIFRAPPAVFKPGLTIAVRQKRPKQVTVSLGEHSQLENVGAAT